MVIFEALADSGTRTWPRVIAQAVLEPGPGPKSGKHDFRESEFRNPADFDQVLVKIWQGSGGLGGVCAFLKVGTWSKLHVVRPSRGLA